MRFSIAVRGDLSANISSISGSKKFTNPVAEPRLYMFNNCRYLLSAPLRAPACFHAEQTISLY